MFRIISLIFLTLNLVLSLKVTDFCVRKQKECRGFYDKNQKHHNKCVTTKCHGQLRYECKSNICSKSKHECKNYIDLDSYIKLINTLNIYHSKFAAKLKNEIQIFEKNLNNCEKKIYKFASNNFCSYGRNCIKIISDLKGFGFNFRQFKTTEKIDCKCPSEQSFKCGKYCATDSIACDYYKSNKNEKQFDHINDCGNNNITTYKANIFYF